MAILVGVAAAMAIGLGWVLQQRVAARSEDSPPLSVGLVLSLIRRPLWWAGIASMAAGQSLGALTLQLASVSLAEGVLSTYLLFAFVIAAAAVRWRPRWQEIVGALLVSAALSLFIAIGRPHSHTERVGLLPAVVAAAAVVALALVLVWAARRRGPVTEALLIATAAGLLYGLQDASTRGALVASDHRGFVAALTHSPWPYIVLGAAAVGVLLSQSAFRAARLDYSLPPTAVAEPLCGVALGTMVLGDRLAVSPHALAIEAACAVAMIGGAVLIGRSPALGPALTAAGPRSEQPAEQSADPSSGPVRGS